jgi:hypothetical protein
MIRKLMGPLAIVGALTVFSLPAMAGYGGFMRVGSARTFGSAVPSYYAGQSSLRPGDAVSLNPQPLPPKESNRFYR